MALKEKTKSKENVKEEKKGKGKSGAGTSGTSYAGVSHAVGGTQTGDLMQDSFRGYRGGSYRPPETIIRGSNTAPATVPAGGALRSSGGYGALRSSMEDYDPAPVMTYEQATAQAQRSYDKYRAKQKAFDEKYGGLEHPEQYYGYRQRSQELGRLQEECVKMVDHMRRHYREMEVEPLFTLSGPVEDPEPYQQQVSAMMSEMEDYIEASNGLPDPTALNQMQTNIVRLQAALLTGKGSQINAANMQGALSRVGANPTSVTQNELPQIQAEERSMLERSLNQIVLGNYSDDVTLLGTAGQFLLGLTGVDVLMDARDLAYDLTHLKEVPGWRVLVDAVSLIPLIGALKNVDEVAALLKAFRRGENLLGASADGVRAGGNLVLAGAGTAENAGTIRRVSESFDAGADMPHTGVQLTETGEVMAGGAGVVEDIDDVDLVDEAIDSGQSLGYNGSNRFGNIDLKPADLMEELANSGVKYTEEDVLMVTRNSNGDLLWLETGKEDAGLVHILAEHESQFRDRNIDGAERIVELLHEILQSTPIRGPRPSHNGYEAIFEHNQKLYLVGYGTNGFVVSFRPFSR